MKKAKSFKANNFLDELLLTLPSYAWLVLFFLVPTLIVFAFAFKPYTIAGGIGEGWTLETFWTAVSANNLAIFWRTIWLSALTTIFCLSLALPACYYIIQTSERLQKLFLLLIVLPFWSSFLVRIFAWKSLLHPEGILKQFLVFLHIVSPDTSLLYNAQTVLIVMIYSYLPFAILPIYAASMKFNFHLIEAAVDLGASRTRAFFKIFLPGIQSGIVTSVLMVFIPALGAYIIPDVVGGPHTEMIGNKIAQRLLVERNLPEASMLSVLLAAGVLLPMTVAAFIQLRSPIENALTNKRKR